MSSDGPFARKQLRECDGLIEALLKVTYNVLKTQEKGKPKCYSSITWLGLCKILHILHKKHQHQI